MQHGRAAMLNSWRCAATAHRVLLELGHHCLLAGCACSVQRPGAALTLVSSLCCLTPAVGGAGGVQVAETRSVQ